MIRVRKAEERGHADHGWLNTYHTFSFARYYDRNHMGFSALRVMNEDWVKPDNGFGTHPHDNMEIITVVLEGELEHKDSMGTGSVIRPGEIQVMSAGSGVTHSEFNPSSENATHLYQIWITPQVRDVEPRYQQRSFSEEELKGSPRLIVSSDGEDGSLQIHQDAKVYWGKLQSGEEWTLPLSQDRKGWIQVIRGEFELDGTKLSTSDGVALEEEGAKTLTAHSDGELLFFDLP